MSKNEKPVLFSDDRSDVERFDPRLHQGSLDPSRIPGYSEIVQANDIEKADALRFREQNAGRTKEDVYKQLGASPRKLEVEFKWLRVSGPGGADSPSAQRDLDHYTTRQGFRLATTEDLTSNGCDMPPAARMAEDGSIRRGPDVALFVRSGEVARMWERYIAEETAKQEGASVPDEFKDGAYRADTFSEEIERETVDVTH